MLSIGRSSMWSSNASRTIFDPSLNCLFSRRSFGMLICPLLVIVALLICNNITSKICKIVFICCELCMYVCWNKYSKGLCFYVRILFGFIKYFSRVCLFLNKSYFDCFLYCFFCSPHKTL